MHPITYYSTRLQPTPPRPSLQGSQETSVCVIGGGLAGLTTALELARAGETVTLLEAEQIGFGASGRNGGFVGPAWSQRFDKLVRTVGEANARNLYAMSQEGVEVVRQNIAELEPPGIELTRGKLSVARKPSWASFSTRVQVLRDELGQTAELWNTDQVRAVLNTSKYFEALHFPNDFQINPLAYARALALKVERLGGKIYEGSRVTALRRTGAGWRISCEHGAIGAQRVVISCGGYTERWSKRQYQSFVPISTYVMLTEAQPELIATAVRTPFAVGDQRRAGDYYRLVEGGTRLLWGGRITTRVSEPSRLASLLHRTMLDTFPQLDGIKIDHAWSGLMAYARHSMPQLGQIESGLWSCTAFGGHGLNTTAIAGKVVSEAILGASDRWKAFAPFGHAWNGGQFGRVAAQATYWWLQMRDGWDETRARSRELTS